MSRGKSVRLLASIPEKYEPDFMSRLDKRTVLGRAIVDRYEAVIADLGGEDGLTERQAQPGATFHVDRGND